ncbi:MAG: alpha/beta fold hydrolase [Rhodanobacter sp.]
MVIADAGFRVIAYDRRGFGRSDLAGNGNSYDDLTDVMKETGADEDAMLAGFSMGGGEVARYMSRHEGKGVVSAVLISSVVPFMLKTDCKPEGTP